MSDPGPGEPSLPTRKRGDGSRLLVVTGASGDVGSALVELAADAGVEVVAADVVAAQGEPAGGVHPAVLDLADDASVTAFARTVIDRCEAGQVEHVAVVHCAGITQVAPFAASDPESWDLLYRVNQRGPLLLTQALLPVLTSIPDSSIVFVGSDSARAGAGREVVYAATKAALVGAAKSLARELARFGTRVNVVSPGPIAGRMVERVTAADPAHLDRLQRAIPLHRLATPADVAAAIWWFVGPDSTYVTGQTLSVSGGITMH